MNPHFITLKPDSQSIVCKQSQLFWLIMYHVHLNMSAYSHTFVYFPFIIIIIILFQVLSYLVNILYYSKTITTNVSFTDSTISIKSGKYMRIAGCITSYNCHVGSVTNWIQNNYLKTVSSIDKVTIVKLIIINREWRWQTSYFNFYSLLHLYFLYSY